MSSKCKLNCLQQPLYDGKTKEYDQEQLQSCLKMLTELNIYLGEHKWAAADYVTLADLAILTMIASCKVNIRKLQSSSI